MTTEKKAKESEREREIHSFSSKKRMYDHQCCQYTDWHDADHCNFIEIIAKFQQRIFKLLWTHKKRNRNIFMTNMGRKSNNYSTTDVESIRKKTQPFDSIVVVTTVFFLSLVFNCEFVKRHCTLAKWQNILIHKLIRH